MLLDIFQNKQCFKLVCGAGNEDAVEVEKLVTLYSKAGCNYFDLCAKPEIVDAAKRGLKRAGIEKDRYLCVSVGISGDPHVSKALIDNEKCLKCESCVQTCPQEAINNESGNLIVNNSKCIGCKQCIKVCPANCIELKNHAKDVNEVLPPLIEKGIDCIELHVVGNDEEEVDQKWTDIQKMYDGPLCISIERSKLGDDAILERIKRMIKDRKPYTTIIQADGISMSGGTDDYKSTLQAIAISELFQNAKLPVFILTSGGTNTKTTELAKMCGLSIDGVAIGSFARKIVKEYVKRDDFLENEKIFNEALKIAKNLVDISLRNMG